MPRPPPAARVAPRARCRQLGLSLPQLPSMPSSSAALPAQTPPPCAAWRRPPAPGRRRQRLPQSSERAMNCSSTSLLFLPVTSTISRIRRRSRATESARALASMACACRRSRVTTCCSQRSMMAMCASCDALSDASPSSLSPRNRAASSDTASSSCPAACFSWSSCAIWRALLKKSFSMSRSLAQKSDWTVSMNAATSWL
mmetsp:Transcript_44651/g.93436  ORF Transcript_44651/g.93436 Transcript_44651/m.93436 type:complete len:200 (-) Transcript_44651:574-1173(-)